MTNASRRKRAWLYCRVAHSDPAMLEMQRVHLIDYAEKQDFAIAGISAEHGSGLDFSRPGLCEVFEAAKNGEADVLLITNYSRLGRDMVKTCRCVQWLNEHHMEVVCADGTIIQDFPEPLDKWLKGQRAP